MKSPVIALTALPLLLIVGFAAADPGQGPKAAAQEESGDSGSSVDLSQASVTKLENGLQVAIQATPGAPSVSVCTAIEAGSRLDPLSAPGAHRVLAEILKDGGYRSSSQDYAALVARRGGTSGVTVERDATVFCTMAPAAELGLALWVTAGRFTPAALTSDELSTVVAGLAERSEQEDAEIFTGRAPTRLRKMAFLGSFEYAHPTLAHADELDTISLETLRGLHGKQYVAERAVVAISGGFTEAEAKALIKEHLATIRAGSPAPTQRVELTAQSTPRFSMAEDPSTKTPAAWYGWVAESEADERAMEAALSLLVSDSRLSKKLVKQTRAAKSLRFLPDELSDPGAPALLRLEVVGSNSRSLGIIEASLDKELRDLGLVGPSEEEVTWVRKELAREAAHQLDTSLGRASALSQGMLAGRRSDQILAPLSADYSGPEITRERIQKAALSLLAPHRRSTVEVYPKGWQDPWQAPMPLYHIVEKGHTLTSIAQRYGTSVAVITKMNGISQNKPIYPGDKLKVPRGKVKKERPLRTHVVRRGDTLSGLAVKYGVNVRGIAEQNGMGSKQTIRTGETLQIPWGSKSDQSKNSNKSSGGSSGSSDASSGSSTTTHKVTSGETLSGIAHKHGVSTVALARANGISHKAMVRVGQTLNVPPRGTGKTEAAPAKIVTYTVKKGDTLSGIAARHHVTVAELTVANQMSRKATLRPGQELKIPQK
jgi:LysM repeat protein/predicted Zn-dependent peptidase